MKTIGEYLVEDGALKDRRVMLTDANDMAQGQLALLAEAKV